jgi:hypothetical protein
MYSPKAKEKGKARRSDANPKKKRKQKHKAFRADSVGPSGSIHLPSSTPEFDDSWESSDLQSGSEDSKDSEIEVRPTIYPHRAGNADAGQSRPSPIPKVEPLSNIVLSATADVIDLTGHPGATQTADEPDDEARQIAAEIVEIISSQQAYQEIQKILP